MRETSKETCQLGCRHFRRGWRKITLHKTAAQYFLLKPAAVPVHCLLAILLVFNFIYNSFMLNVTIETKRIPEGNNGTDGTVRITQNFSSLKYFLFSFIYTSLFFILHKFSPRKKKMWDDSLFHALKLWTCSDFKCLFVCLPWMRERESSSRHKMADNSMSLLDDYIQFQRVGSLPAILAREFLQCELMDWVNDSLIATFGFLVLLIKVTYPCFLLV